jgi:FkbM family methyltransferase
MYETLIKMTPEFVKSAIRFVFQPYSFHLSQAGQDLWVFGEMFNEKKAGFFLDLGAHDGVLISNTYLLERKYLWNGICIEANPDSFRQLQRNRRATCIHACVDSTARLVNFVKRGMQGGILSSDTDNKEGSNETEEIFQVETKTLESILVESKAPFEIDYLSVDIEGSEQRVLGSFDFGKYRFKCLTIERPTELLRNILKENDYVLVKDIPSLDCFYIHKSAVEEYSANVFEFYRKKRLTLRWR